MRLRHQGLERRSRGVWQGWRSACPAGLAERTREGRIAVASLQGMPAVLPVGHRRHYQDHDLRGSVPLPLRTPVAQVLASCSATRFGVFMPESGTTIVACPSCTAREARDRDAVIYDRHATGLYRQALLTPGHRRMHW
jgi:hypothetical protein